MERYKCRLPGSLTITADNWKYDFSRDRNHPFNAEATFVFSQSFLTALNNGSYNDDPLPVLFWDQKYIQATFHEQLKYLSGLYKEQQDPLRSKATTRQAKNARARRKRQVCGIVNLAITRQLIIHNSLAL
jgi:hypothetical protein